MEYSMTVIGMGIRVWYAGDAEIRPISRNMQNIAISAFTVMRIYILLR